MERLEPRLTPAATLLDIAAARAPTSPTDAGYPALPIPAGATLLDTSDAGLQVLFSSADPNVIAGQETVPAPGVQNLFWMDLSNGLSAPTIRLVTHVAGSTFASAGFAGIGKGVWAPFEPDSADLSGDGQFVVFDSRVNAHELDATVPAQNDQPTYLPPHLDPVTGFPVYDREGTPDVFVWSAAAADPANNITAVDLLNATGREQAVAGVVVGQAIPDPSRPMVAGVFSEGWLPPVDPLASNWEAFVTRDITDVAMNANRGITDDGSRVLYESFVPVNWIDTVNPTIRDQSAKGDWSLDGLLVDGTRTVSAAALQAGGSTRTATKDFMGDALGLFRQNMPFAQGTLPQELFEVEYLQLSATGNRVVYSIRQNGGRVVAGVFDTDFSLDVFAYDVVADTNLLVSRATIHPKYAAGYQQANYAPGTDLEFWDSMNHSVSADGLTVAMTSSAANMVKGMVDNSTEVAEVTFLPAGQAILPSPGLKFIEVVQHAPFDIYASRSDTLTTKLVNTPNGLANTNLLATFGGMSADGSTLLFQTSANNFYNPAFGNPPYPPFATGPLPKNFLLGGFSNVWARDVDAGKTTLVSISSDGGASGNRASTVAEVLPGARDTLANISASGRFALFSSTSNNLVAGIADRAFVGGEFLRDLDGATTVLTSTAVTSNVPSSGVYRASSLSTDDALGRARIFLGGTAGADMQTRFRTDDVAPRASHVYTLDYPLTGLASSGVSAASFAVAGTGELASSALEYRGPRQTVRNTPGTLLPAFKGEWRVASGDVNADGVADTIYGTGTANGTGTGSVGQLFVVDGRTNAVIWQALPFEGLDLTKRGMFVAAGDVNADGYADVIVTTGAGGPPLSRIFDGRRGTLLREFAPYATGTAGVRVAAGDTDGDGCADVIVAPGKGAAPVVNVFSGRLLVSQAPVATALLRSITVSAASGPQPDGILVAAADMNNDGRADIVTGSTTAPAVRVYDGATGKAIGTPLAVGAEFSAGVRVAARAGTVIIASAVGNDPLVKILAFAGWQTLDTFTPPGVAKTNRFGLFVG